MKNFIPFEKLSKSKQRELNKQKRSTWGSLNPVTRKSANPKAYNRKKTQNWKDDYFNNSESFNIFSHIPTIQFKLMQNGIEIIYRLRSFATSSRLSSTTLKLKSAMYLLSLQ